MMDLSEGVPDRLMDAEGVRILDERREKQIERFLRMLAGGQMTRQRQPRAPVLGVVVDEPPAQAREPFRGAGSRRQPLQPLEREVRTVWRHLDELVPDARGLL